MLNGPTMSELRQVPLFSRLPEESLARLASRCRRRRFPAREALFHDGDPGEVLYLILSGGVNIQKTTSGGEVVHIARRGPGETVGEMAILDGEPRSADAVTAEATDLVMLHRDEFRRCLEEAPRLALDILACMAARLREAAEQTTRHQELDALGRLAQLILAEMDAGGEPDPKGGTRVPLRLTQQEIAERIGTTRETVSRALSRLRSLGIVRAEKGCLVVLNPAKLRRYCTP